MTESTELRIWPLDGAVLNLTLDALAAAKPHRPSVTYICARGCSIAAAGSLPKFGPLFVASGWQVELPIAEEAYVQDSPDGEPRRLSRKEFLALQDVLSGPVVSGRALTFTGTEGTVALLALPLDMPQEYPDLLVRCRHGDALLERTEVLGHIRADSFMRIKVPTGFPRFTYSSLPELPSGRGRQRVMREVRRFGARADTAFPDASG